MHIAPGCARRGGARGLLYWVRSVGMGVLMYIRDIHMHACIFRDFPVLVFPFFFTAQRWGRDDGFDRKGPWGLGCREGEQGGRHGSSAHEEKPQSGKAAHG